uniref:Ig-like domain-containing protein n=1 Tax=Oryzias latipes TaxID=8090 RepID=A0A3P9J7H6_ORYLA
LFRDHQSDSTFTHLSLMFTDAEVSCQFGQSCILNCSFPPGDHLEIHWIKPTPTYTKVHSYYDNKDHLEHQDQRFRGRTPLFQDQISKGNASLQLTGVMVQDEGSYRCLTSTIIDETLKVLVQIPAVCFCVDFACSPHACVGFLQTLWFSFHCPETCFIGYLVILRCH